MTPDSSGCVGSSLARIR